MSVLSRVVLTSAPSHKRVLTQIAIANQNTLRFDADFIALHLSQLLRLLDQMCVDGLGMRTAFGDPGAHRPLVQFEARDHRLYRTTVRQQGQHLRDERCL